MRPLPLLLPCRHGVYTLVKNARDGNYWWAATFWSGSPSAAARAANLTGMGVVTGVREVAPSEMLEVGQRA